MDSADTFVFSVLAMAFVAALGPNEAVNMAMGWTSAAGLFCWMTFYG